MPSALGGRPTKLNADVCEKALHYIENYDEAPYEHAIPSIIGLAVVLSVGKTTLYRWGEVDDSVDRPEEETENRTRFRGILEKCNAAQEFTLIDKGLKNDVNPTIAKLALGKHGYHDKSDNTLTGKDGGPLEVRDMSQYTDEQLEAIIDGSSRG